MYPLKVLVSIFRAAMINLKSPAHNAEKQFVRKPLIARSLIDINNIPLRPKHAVASLPRVCWI